jgi:hypothetical protein
MLRSVNPEYVYARERRTLGNTDCDLALRGQGLESYGLLALTFRSVPRNTYTVTNESPGWRTL